MKKINELEPLDSVILVTNSLYCSLMIFLPLTKWQQLLLADVATFNFFSQFPTPLCHSGSERKKINLSLTACALYTYWLAKGYYSYFLLKPDEKKWHIKSIHLAKIFTHSGNGVLIKNCEQPWRKDKVIDPSGSYIFPKAKSNVGV